MPISDAYFAFARGGVNYRALSPELDTKTEDDDVFFVQTSGVTVKATKAMVRDGDSRLDYDNDLVAYTDTTNSTTYKTPLSTLKDLLFGGATLPPGYAALYVYGINVRFYKFYVTENTKILREDGSTHMNCDAGKALTCRFDQNTNYLIPCDKLTGWFSMWDGTSQTGDFEFGTGFHINEVTSLAMCFRNTSYTGTQIREWDTSKVTDMSMLAYGDTTHNEFSGDLSTWDVSNVTTFSKAFMSQYSFNIDLTNWNPINGQRFDQMFANSRAFDQDLSGWCVPKSTNTDRVFRSSGMDSKTSQHPKWGDPC